MSTQYDKIGAEYNKTKALPCGRLEVLNFRAALEPYIKGANVLDLASGAGFYSKLLLDWGAASVVGVDISPQMVQVANQNLTDIQKSHITFLVADCSEPIKYDGGPFDLVIGAWLLNYASSPEIMTKMFSNVSENLKAGGVFVGVSPYPTSDPDHYTMILETQQNGKYKCSTTKNESVNHGVSLHTKLFAEPTPVEFDNYHLRQEVYQQSARDGGMDGHFQWLPIAITPMPDLPDAFWDGYLEAPYFSILSVGK